jgi:hypothetical protein
MTAAVPNSEGVDALVSEAGGKLCCSAVYLTAERLSRAAGANCSFAPHANAKCCMHTHATKASRENERRVTFFFWFRNAAGLMETKGYELMVQ